MKNVELDINDYLRLNIWKPLGESVWFMNEDIPELWGIPSRDLHWLIVTNS